MRIYLLNIFLALTFLAGCNYRVDKNAGDSSNLIQDTAQLDYAFVLEKIIKPKCFECHSVTREVRDGIALDTYAQLKDILADVRSEVETDSMPKRRTPLTASEKQLLFAWIDAGAPEKVGTAQPPPSPEPPPVEPPPVEPPPVEPPPAEPPPTLPEPVLDYATVHREVIEPMCFSCHQAPNNKGDVNLETYEEVIKNIALVKETIEDGSMPRRRKISPEQKEMILSWIAAGAPEKATLDSSDAAEKESLTGSLVDFLIQQKEPQHLRKGK